MKHVWLSIALIAACGTPPPPSAPASDVAARIERIEHGLLPGLQLVGEEQRTSLLDRMRELKIPAVSIAVFDHYELQWAKAYGLADVEQGTAATSETLFQAASISKPVNALGIMLAVADRTLLPLDTPINEQLSSWKLPDSDLAKGKPATLRRLLSHTAGTTVHGFPGYDVDVPRPTVQQILDGTPPANSPAVRIDIEPGKFRYSGGGITITQLALEERSKEAYDEILRTRVLGPIGMTQSSYTQPPPQHLAFVAATAYHGDGKAVHGRFHVYPEMAAAGLWTTPRDLARFFLEMSLARAGRSKVISPTIATEMTTKVPDTGPGDDGTGLGVFLFGRNGARFFGHSGGNEGFQCDAVASLDGGYGVVIMTNSDNGGQLFGEIERAVFAEYGWPGKDTPVTRFAMAAEQRARFVGAFSPGDFGPIVIEEKGGKLLIGPPIGDRTELVPIAADTVVSISGERFRIAANGSLEVVHGDMVIKRLPRFTSDAKHPLLELAAGRFDDAVAAWKARAATDPKAAVAEESFGNQYGYQLLQNNRPSDAVLVMRLVATVFPESSNAHDSLGDVYMQTGDKAHAIEEYERALATLDTDPRMTPEMKTAARANAETQLAKLRAK